MIKSWLSFIKAPARLWLSTWILILSLLLPVQALLWPVEPVWAKSKAELQLQNQDNQKKLQRIRQLKQQIIIKERRITSNIIKNQQRIDSTSSSLKQKEEQLEVAKTNLVQLERALDVAVSEQKRLSDQVGQRLRSFYMGEHLGMLDLLLDAVNISNFMDRLYFQRRIYDQDKVLIKQYFERTKALKAKKQQLAWQKERLASNIRAIENYQDQLKESIQLDQLLVQKLKTSKKAYEMAEAQLQRESYEIQLQIQRATRSIKGPIKGSTGRMMAPVMAPITSNFGYRTHPVYRTSKFHSGTDFGARSGSPIRAADGGTVIYAGWRGGYGKVVIINHGNNITTLYAHMSGIAVGSGASVAQGQVIGYVGTTGLSTGPHLHFEVRDNGRPVNPLSYLH